MPRVARDRGTALERLIAAAGLTQKQLSELAAARLVAGGLPGISDDYVNELLRKPKRARANAAALNAIVDVLSERLARPLAWAEIFDERGRPLPAGAAGADLGGARFSIRMPARGMAGQPYGGEGEYRAPPAMPVLPPEARRFVLSLVAELTALYARHQLPLSPAEAAAIALEELMDHALTFAAPDFGEHARNTLVNVIILRRERQLARRQREAAEQ